MNPAIDESKIARYQTMLDEISGGDWVVSVLSDGAITIRDRSSTLYSHATMDALLRLKQAVPHKPTQQKK